jgi:hypothetical protein
MNGGAFDLQFNDIWHGLWNGSDNGYQPKKRHCTINTPYH